MEDKGKKLYIPVNVKKRKEFLGIDGIGGKEVAGIGISIGIGCLIGIILFFVLNKNPIVLVMPIFTFGSGGYIFLKKDRTNRNSIDKVSLFFVFLRSQKRFYYNYKNIYESRREIKIVK